VSADAVDVAVVGGGPAGLAAAVELRRNGVARVVVLDRESEAGGTPRHCHHTGFGFFDLKRVLSGPGYARRRRRLAEDAGVEILTDTTVLSLAPRTSSTPTTLATTSPLGLRDIEARAVLLATGCRERPRAARLVPGTRPLGVYTTGSLQQLVYARGASPGRRAVVVGAEHVSFSAAHTLMAAGAEVVAIVTEKLEDQTYPPFRLAVATLHGVPVLTRTRVSRIDGRRRVEGVEVTSLDGGRREVLACDSVVFTGDWIPDHEVARGAGIAIDTGTRGPSVDAALRTSRRGVFAAGNLLHGAAIADVAALEGLAAARGIAAFLERSDWPNEGSSLSLAVEAPLAWIVPSLIAPSLPLPPRGRFLFQTTEFLRDASVEVRQDGKLLYSERFRRLVPNRTLELDGKWIAHARQDGGAVVARALR
jgi:thioredoxin reductase